jgi:hypothetical protein
VRQLPAIAAEHLGVPAKVSSMPYAALWAYGVFNPFGRELRETQHQFRKPFVLDSTPAQQTFGLKPHRLVDSVAYDLANDIAATSA